MGSHLTLPSTNIYFDTEFMEDGHTIELLSIGMVREDGAEYYAEAAWVDHRKANDWVRANVLPHLDATGGSLRSKPKMKQDILRFCGGHPKFWAWFASYDWVVLCQLFGRMVDLPPHWPMRVNDVAQACEGLERVGATPEPVQTSTEHHALNDARWTRDMHLWVMEHEARRRHPSSKPRRNVWDPNNPYGVYDRGC